MNHFDALETRSADERNQDLFSRLGKHLSAAAVKLPALADHLAGHDLAGVTSRKALAKLPVFRKADLMNAQTANPPFGGFVDLEHLKGSRIYLSPGPVWEPQSGDDETWGGARALYAAGFRAGEIVHNSLAYHMTPGGFIIDAGLRALGCTVFPAGIGQTEQQVEAARALKPAGYAGTPDYLKVILDKADEMGVDLSSITKALVSGGALFPSMREEYAKRGVTVLQAFATADLGMIAYESLHEGQLAGGMIVNENLVVEIVRPGTGDPVAEGEVGELVVTNLSAAYPLVRFATGDLSAVLPGTSPCGRTNMRIQGWMGRADQRTKVKGMFVDPKQIAELVGRFESVAAARLVVGRDGDRDIMSLLVKAEGGASPDADQIATAMREITKLGGTVSVVEDLPNDGKVISDERDYDS